MKRKTISSEFIVEGKGIHRGNHNILIVKPYNGRGIVFRNPDNGKSVLATLDNVVSLNRGTVIGIDGFEVATVEHLLSCFSAFDIDDVEIEIRGDEIPAFDGSVALICELIKKVGVVEKEESVDIIEIEEPFFYITKNSFYKIEKCEGVFFDVTFENSHPMIGVQRFEYKLSTDSYISEIAKARTFVFEDEIEKLKANGLAKGGSLDNTIVISKDGVLNKEGLRYRDEFVRHKLLDLIGDLKLLNARLNNIKIIAKRPSHKANISLAKLIKARSIYERREKST